MDRSAKLSKIILYQNVGFLVVIALGFLDEMTRLSALVFGDGPAVWEFRRSTLAMLLVLTVWFLVSRSTRRILDRLLYLEKFMRVCAWCHDVNHKGHWMPLTEFLQQGFDTPTTHGICPRCLAEQKAAIARAKLSNPDRSETTSESTSGACPELETETKSHVLGTGRPGDSVTTS